MAQVAKIPVIDISSDNEQDQQQMAKALVEAAIEHGFIYIKNTGKDIPIEAVEGAFNLVSSFLMDTLTPSLRLHSVPVVVTNSQITVKTTV